MRVEQTKSSKIALQRGRRSESTEMLVPAVAIRPVSMLQRGRRSESTEMTLPPGMTSSTRWLQRGRRSESTEMCFGAFVTDMEGAGFKGAVDQSRRRSGPALGRDVHGCIASKGPSIRVDGDARFADGCAKSI